jgi:queuine tRNA-ribosyltransferase
MGAQIILGNTFHLWLRPGLDVIAPSAACTASRAGAGRCSPTAAASRSGAWATMRKISEEGVRFASPVNGDKLFLTPEVSMQIQTVLNSDIVMQFDECTPYETAGPLTTEPRRARRWS